MHIQELHERLVPAPALDQRADVVHDVERVRPLVALRPARVRARPRAARVARLHEPSVIVEDRERRGERTGAEVGGVCVLAECGGEHGYGVVIIWDDRVSVFRGKERKERTDMHSREYGIRLRNGHRLRPSRV